MDILQNYTKKIEDEILQSEQKIASIERRISRLKAKLKAPDKALASEQGKGTKRFRAANGEKVVHKSKNFSHLKEKVSEVDSPAAAPVAIEEKKEVPKKSSWLF